MKSFTHTHFVYFTWKYFLQRKEITKGAWFALFSPFNKIHRESFNPNGVHRKLNRIARKHCSQGLNSIRNPNDVKLAIMLCWYFGHDGSFDVNINWQQYKLVTIILYNRTENIHPNVFAKISRWWSNTDYVYVHEIGIVFINLKST